MEGPGWRGWGGLGCGGVKLGGGLEKGGWRMRTRVRRGGGQKVVLD